VVSAASAGICEETGFRGYMQQQIEQRHGAPTAILVSSFCFMLRRRLSDATRRARHHGIRATKSGPARVSRVFPTAYGTL
jgi:hypothetical protein